MPPFTPTRLALAIALIAPLWSPVSRADDDKQLGEMVVNSQKSPLPADLPATSEGVSAAQIAETINGPTTAALTPLNQVRQRA